jgi:hypothetical protein
MLTFEHSLNLAQSNHQRVVLVFATFALIEMDANTFQSPWERSAVKLSLRELVHESQTPITAHRIILRD